MVSVVIELGANRKLCNEAGELPGQVNEEAPHTLKKADMLIEIKKQRELVERAKAGATAKDARRPSAAKKISSSKTSVPTRPRGSLT